MTVYKTLRALFCAIEWHKKVPIKGLEKGDGVPPPHKAMAGQVGEEGKNLSSKGLFPLLKYRPLLGTEQTLKISLV